MKIICMLTALLFWSLAFCVPPGLAQGIYTASALFTTLGWFRREMEGGGS